GVRRDRRPVRIVARGVVDHQHVDRDLPPVALQRREAALQPGPGVEVHDDDGDVCRRGIAHACGVCATSTMPTTMHATPSQRRGGTVSWSTNTENATISTYPSAANG